MMHIFCVINTAGNPTRVVANHPNEALEHTLRLGSIRKYENGTVKEVTEHYIEDPNQEGFGAESSAKRQKSITKILNGTRIGEICLHVEPQDYKVTTWDEVQEYRKMFLSNILTKQEKIQKLETAKKEYEKLLEYPDKLNPNIDYQNIINRINNTIERVKRVEEGN